MLNLTIDQLRAIALAAHSCDESIPEFLFRNQGSEAVHTIQELEAFLVEIAERITPEFNQVMQYFPEWVRAIDATTKPPLPTTTKQVKDLQVGDRFWWFKRVVTIESLEIQEAKTFIHGKTVMVEGLPRKAELILFNHDILDIITHPDAPFATWDDYLAAMRRESNTPQLLATQKLAKDLQVGDVIDTDSGPATITKVEVKAYTYIWFERGISENAALLNDRIIDLLPPSGQTQ